MKNELLQQGEFVLTLPDGRLLVVESRQPSPGERAWRVGGVDVGNDDELIDYIIESDNGIDFGWVAMAADSYGAYPTVVLRVVQP